MPSLWRGRCLHAETDTLWISAHGETQRIPALAIPHPEEWIGHWIEIRDGKPTLLTPNRTAERSTGWHAHVQSPRRHHGTRVRTQVEDGIRAHFRKQGFLETRTPLLVPSPGMETHIRPFAVTRTAQLPHTPPLASDELSYFLPTSPEFAMKRLLAGGLEKIFQICPAFRDEPRSPTHRPEFTMLEWYRAHASYRDLQNDVETLVQALALAVRGKPEIRFQEKTISVQTPWPRLRVRDLFVEHAGVDLVACASSPSLANECRRLGLSARQDEPWDDLYFKIWLNIVEPRLPSDQAFFVERYPASQAALAGLDRDPDGTVWAKRFEAYAGGIELGNAFEELTDPIEQRARFERDMRERQAIYGEAFPASPIDEGFLSALSEGMPPASGIAMGVDRLVMLLASEPEIDYTFWL